MRHKTTEKTVFLLQNPIFFIQNILFDKTGNTISVPQKAYIATPNKPFHIIKKPVSYGQKNIAETQRDSTSLQSDTYKKSSNSEKIRYKKLLLHKNSVK